MKLTNSMLRRFLLDTGACESFVEHFDRWGDPIAGFHYLSALHRFHAYEFLVQKLRDYIDTRGCFYGFDTGTGARSHRPIYCSRGLYLTTKEKCDAYREAISDDLLAWAITQYVLEDT